MKYLLFLIPILLLAGCATAEKEDSPLDLASAINALEGGNK